jgi:hypothetical protein
LARTSAEGLRPPAGKTRSVGLNVFLYIFEMAVLIFVIVVLVRDLRD